MATGLAAANENTPHNPIRVTPDSLDNGLPLNTSSVEALAKRLVSMEEIKVNRPYIRRLMGKYSPPPPPDV